MLIFQKLNPYSMVIEEMYQHSGKPTKLSMFHNGFIFELHGNGFDHYKSRLVQWYIELVHALKITKVEICCKLRENLALKNTEIFMLLNHNYWSLAGILLMIDLLPFFNV